MLRYCKHCGTLLEDDAKVCSFCGKTLEIPTHEPAPQEAPATTPPEQPVKTPAKFNWQTLKEKITKKHLLIGGIVLGVIILAVAVYLLFFNPHIAISRYAAVHNGDYDQLESLAPREYWIRSAKNNSATSVESYIDKHTENLEKYHQQMRDTDSGQYGTLTSISYQVLDTEKVASEDLSGIKAALEERYEIAGHRIGTAYNLIVKVTFRGTEGNLTRPGYVTAIQIDGQWYLIRYNKYKDDYSATFITDGNIATTYY